MNPKRAFRRCSTWLAVAGVVLVLNGGCSKPADVTESGALLISLSTPAGAPQPDELRVSVYDDSGALFKAARVPQQGALPASVPGRPLGTVLIQPGDSTGLLRVHVRGLRLGARVLDGATQVTDDARKHGILELLLDTTVPADSDGDDVPDLIDDCPDQADPDQKGCPGGTSHVPEDAGTDLAGRGGQGGEEWAGTGGGDAGSEGNGSGGASADGPAATGGDGGGNAGAPGTAGTPGGGAGGGTGNLASGGNNGTGGAGTGGGMASGGTDSTPDAGSDGASNATRKALGAVCATSPECASAFCVDRVCCQTICNQPCQACGTAGRCVAVIRAKDTPECAGNRSCNSTGRCLGG
ncbi:MAG: hypothetical protein ABI560_03955 [Myxococcales bacterium]